MRRLRRFAIAIATALMAWTVGFSGSAAVPPAAIAVSGNHLIDSRGNTVVLHGVNRAGTEYACAQGWGIFDGPSDDASIASIAAWHVNVVRIPLNEDCWLGINGVPWWAGGTSYQTAIVNYVNLLHQRGLYAILDLQWTAPGTQLALGMQPMPDADHAPAFWQSVATTFKSDSAVLFDLFNEPEFVSWTCWRDGAGCPMGWSVAGMQVLVNAVRGTGATQPILLSGPAYGNDLSQWLNYLPSDSANALVASFHTYDYQPCKTAQCWNATLLPVARQVPVVTGELGETDCAHGYIDQYMSWADTNAVSYLGWTWNVWDCAYGPSLITSFDGTPTPFGLGLRNHLLALP